MTEISRRQFVKIGAAAAAPLLDPVAPRAASFTAQQIVDRVREQAGVAWRSPTVDTFKAGDPSTVVTGVVTASVGTIDVLRRAARAGANMVITAGPTFYSRADTPTPAAGRGRGAAPPTPSADPVFAAKIAFIKTNNLVVWRFSDHWRLRTPDPAVQGLIDTLGWTRYRVNDDGQRVTVPALALERLVDHIKDRLNARGGMRIIGNRQSRVRRIGVLPGSVPIQAALTLLPEVDVIIAGEIREWETSEYVRDSVTAGLEKGLILIGRTLSEEPGMRLCAQWLQTVVPDVPCRWMPVGDPYWRPAT
jgi:putative NIF3 family GTP cyclohydrolase 1 type 2